MKLYYRHKREDSASMNATPDEGDFDYDQMCKEMCLGNLVSITKRHTLSVISRDSQKVLQ